MYDDPDHLPQSLVIYDTEYTSWRGSQERSWSGAREYQELVQIGAIHVIKRNSKYYVTRSISIIMCPKRNPLLSQYFIDLTGIEQIDVDKGMSIEEGIREFKNFADDDDCFSYGSDYDIIEKNLDLIALDGTIMNDSYRTWKNNHHDIRVILDKFIDTSAYTSGEVHKGFTDKDLSLQNHNALQDCYSILYALNSVISDHD